MQYSHVHYNGINVEMCCHLSWKPRTKPYQIYCTAPQFLKMARGSRNWWVRWVHPKCMHIAWGLSPTDEWAAASDQIRGGQATTITRGALTVWSNWGVGGSAAGFGGLDPISSYTVKIAWRMWWSTEKQPHTLLDISGRRSRLSQKHHIITSISEPGIKGS